MPASFGVAAGLLRGNFALSARSLALDASEVTQRVSHLTIDYSTPTWIPGSCCKTTQLVQLSRKVAVRLRLIEQISYQVFG